MPVRLMKPVRHNRDNLYCPFPPIPRKPKVIIDPCALKKPTKPWAVMIQDAVKTLNEPGGSGVVIIKKYILANYRVRLGKLTQYMKRGFKVAVTARTLVQVKGKGMTGSFKLRENIFDGENDKSADKPISPKKVKSKFKKPVTSTKLKTVGDAQPERKSPTNTNVATKSTGKSKKLASSTTKKALKASKVITFKEKTTKNVTSKPNSKCTPK